MNRKEELASAAAGALIAVQGAWDALRKEASSRLLLPLEDRLEELRRTGRALQRDAAARLLLLNSTRKSNDDSKRGRESVRDGHAQGVLASINHAPHRLSLMAEGGRHGGALDAAATSTSTLRSPEHVQGEFPQKLTPFQGDDDVEEDMDMADEEQEARFLELQARLEAPKTGGGRRTAASHFSETAGGIGAVVNSPKAAARVAEEGRDGALTSFAALEGLGRGPNGESEMDKVWHAPVTKEELGRATWTLLHTLAAQYPEKPSQKLQNDVKAFVKLLPFVYPCRICGEHFKEVIKSNPPQCGSRNELEQYMCRIHNVVNRSLNKPEFPCKRVVQRWGSVECDDNACQL